MAGIGDFNADALVRPGMQLREALGDLPDTVFADLLENDDAYLLIVDLPGATAETVEITIEGGQLTIQARREKDVPREFRYVSEDRDLFLDAELPLPGDATGADAEGEIDRGVLTITLPKSSAEGGTKIPLS